MNHVYRYLFTNKVPLDEIESSLLLALLGTSSLHGETQTRLDASHYVDPSTLACVIDATTEVGRDFNKLFAGFLRREFGEEGFQVVRLPAVPPKEAAGSPTPCEA